MSFVRLSDGCYVDADEVLEVTLSDYNTMITVRMKNGIGHFVDTDYRIGVYATMDLLIDKINAAKTRAAIQAEANT